MKSKIEKQIKLFKKYGIKKYIINDNIININQDVELENLTEIEPYIFDNCIINGYLNLRLLKEAPEGFLKNTTVKDLYLNSLEKVYTDFLTNKNINELYLDSLKICTKDFLKNTNVNYLSLSSLTNVHEDFLKGTTVNYLNLHSLTNVHKDFIKNTTVNFLNLHSLPSELRETIQSNIKPLIDGYNQEKGYCYFDGILRKVVNVTNKLGYTIYETPFDFVIEKDGCTSHGKTVKKGIQDLEFKILRDKVQKEPIYLDSDVTVKLYRMITGACEFGVKEWLDKHKIEYIYKEDVLVEKQAMKVSELLPILEKEKPFGFDKFKSLIK